jgi:hypothetical protein
METDDLGALGFDARDFSPARTPDLPAIRGRIPALLATPLWPPRAVIITGVLCVPPTFSLGRSLLHPHGNDVKYPAETKVTGYTDQQITVKVAQ